MLKWVQKAYYYRDPHVLAVLFLGFASGLPFLLTLATLHVWLSEGGASKTTIGLFVLVTIPYSLKFIWAPLVDHKPFPYLSSFFGRRKGWLVGSQLGVIAFLLALGASHPQENLLYTALCALFVAFFSATQDIVYEAFRVELLSKDLAGPGAGASSFGYRLGMWVAGAGALYLASFFSWFVVYAFMAICMVMGIIAALVSPEPHCPSSLPSSSSSFKLSNLFEKSFKSLWMQPDLGLVLGFIFLYKIADTVLNTLTMPFLLEIGFSKLEIAHVAKTFGIFTMMVGGLMGGMWLASWPLFLILLWVASLQFIASLMFMAQALIGYDLSFLFLTIGIENFACGLGTSAFIVFLSNRCQTPFTGTHFALLSSFGSLCRIIISALGGLMADYCAWPSFYGITACLVAPCFMLVWSHKSKFSKIAKAGYVTAFK